MKAHAFFFFLLSHLAVLTDSLKLKTWLGANNFLSRQGVSVRHNSSALVEMNGKIYIFGGLNGPGGN
jgi:hypothetical protein